MAAILIMTGTGGAEGTLGGLGVLRAPSAGASTSCGRLVLSAQAQLEDVQLRFERDGLAVQPRRLRHPGGPAQPADAVNGGQEAVVEAELEGSEREAIQACAIKGRAKCVTEP